MTGGHFLVDEGVKIEENTLKVQDQGAWGLADACLF